MSPSGAGGGGDSRANAGAGRGCGVGNGAAGALSPSDVRSLLASRFWTRIEGGGPTGSTNDDARALALAGAPEGTVVLASEQTEGRGRFGREWLSPHGGAYLSALLRPQVPTAARTGSLPEHASLPLVVGLGVALGFETLGARVGLKWPNDIMLLSPTADAAGRPREPGKVAGVLVESGADVSGGPWAVAGVGLNVRRPDTAVLSVREVVTDSTPSPPAAYLADIWPDADLVRLVAAVLDSIAETYATYSANGFGALRAAYTKRCLTLGSDVVVSNATGGRIVEGFATGVAEDGRLLVAMHEGEIAVASGEVTLRDGCAR